MQVSGVNAFGGANLGAVSSQKKIKSQSQSSVTSPMGKSIQYASSLPYYTNNIHFGRSLKEHRSWGARINPETKEVTFKILTFPDAKKVEVKVFDNNDKENVQKFELKNMGRGVFETKDPISPDKIKEGDRYSFVITKKDGSTDEVKDPYAMRQGNGTSEAFMGPSILYDHSRFEWKNDEAWKKNPERITRSPKNGGLGVRNANIYEVQIDTLTKKGTFDAAKQKLEEIKATGFNTVEFMPNENTFNFNWGYDGVDKFAVPEHRGGPDKFKELVDYAHGLGMNVVMDYVPNHLGPNGAQLQRTGPYIKGPNEFGDAFNFEGENSKHVRDYIVNAGMNWIDNYHVDGLRLDMTKFMGSDFTMKEIAAEINYHFPDAFLIAEDSRTGINVSEHGFWPDQNELHDKRVTTRLTSPESCEGASEAAHERYIDSLDRTIVDFNSGNTEKINVLRNLGYDSEWDFSYTHALDRAVHVHDNMGELENTIYHSQHAVKYVTSHDETGNMDGTRPVIKYLVPKLNLNSHVVLNEDDLARAQELSYAKGSSLDEAKWTVTCQKAQNVAESLATMFCEGKLTQYKGRDQELYDEVLKPLGIAKSAEITYKKFETNFRLSASQHRMAQALTYSIPGPKMVFQGDENLNLAPFRFFREFEGENNKYEDYLKRDKGYEPGRPALEASKLDGAKYSKKAKGFMKEFKQLTEDLNRFSIENPAVSDGYLVLRADGSRDSVIHNGVIGLHTKDEKTQEEIFVISNFRNEDFPSDENNSYNIHFPEGVWEEVLNTDDTKYGGTGRFSNKELIEGKGITDSHEDKQPIKLAKYSTIYFKRVA